MTICSRCMWVSFCIEMIVCALLFVVWFIILACKEFNDSSNIRNRSNIRSMSTQCEETHWYFPTGVQCKPWRILIMNSVKINIHTGARALVCMYLMSDIWWWYLEMESPLFDGRIFAREKNNFVRTLRLELKHSNKSGSAWLWIFE